MDAPPRRQITLPGGQRSCREPVSRPVVTTGAGHPIRVQAEPAEGPDPIEEPLQRRLGMDVNRRLVSAAIATAAAALFATGVVSTATAQEVKVKCYGANACKGKSECKTSMSGCKGKNACKGQGFEQMTEKACVDKLGRA
jgi:hypothetical protein